MSLGLRLSPPPPPPPREEVPSKSSIEAFSLISLGRGEEGDPPSRASEVVEACGIEVEDDRPKNRWRNANSADALSSRTRDKERKMLSTGRT